MSDIYTTLQVSPRKKRCPPLDDDSTTFTPKKLRKLAYVLSKPLLTPTEHPNRPPTPPPTSSRRSKTKPAVQFPDHLARLDRIHIALQQALSHALATCAVSPSSDTGIVRNVLNHLSLSTYTGLSTQFELDDLRRLCWVWEWDAKVLPSDPKSTNTTTTPEDDEENPFLVTPSSPGASSSLSAAAGDWTRGGMGIVLSSATHHSKRDRKRVPAYGIGIEVEMDIDKDMGGGMAAVARWTAAAETRRSEFRDKLRAWIDLHPDAPSVPQIPIADLPELAMPAKISALTRTLASASPKAAIKAMATALPPPVPSSPSRSPTKRALRDFAVPFPIPSSSSLSSTSLSSIANSPTKRNSVLFPMLRSDSPTKGLLFPQTPSRRAGAGADLFSPRTPASSIKSKSTTASEAPESTTGSTFDPSTPTHQRGKNASTAPETPTSSRRQALYERVRQKSLQASPTKTALSAEVRGGSGLTRDQVLRMGQEEMRRRCLLGRLGGVAESVWMLFSTPAAGSSATPTARKRRALPKQEVVTAVIKSSPVPISNAEAGESLAMLTKLCPFFIRELDIAGKEWLEMPAAKPDNNNNGNADLIESTPTKKKGGGGGSKSMPAPPPSPGPAVKGKHESAEELVTRSPRRVKREGGGLREVREIIRQELELQD
ncbi:hypothetical protein H0H92_004823 [Tricholoma furcatifolium]|nr:hypothetical protein H0H92_004823 [Tricholoma furcatifolium]